MKPLNFDALTNFEVPEEWIEKALSAKPKKKPFIFRPYVIGSAAAIVLAVGITVFAVATLKNNSQKPNALVAAPMATVETTDYTEPVQDTAEAQPVTQPETAAQTEPSETQKPTQPPETTPVETQPINTQAPETQPPVETTEDESSKYQMSTEWFTDVRSVRPEPWGPACESPSVEPPKLDISELYTGDVIIKVAPDSLFYESARIDVSITATHKESGARFSGTVITAPEKDENGEAVTRFNFFENNVYIPDNCEYTFEFRAYDENGDFIPDSYKTVKLTPTGDQTAEITI